MSSVLGFRLSNRGRDTHNSLIQFICHLVNRIDFHRLFMLLIVFCLLRLRVIILLQCQAQIVLASSIIGRVLLVELDFILRTGLLLLLGGSTVLFLIVILQDDQLNDRFKIALFFHNCRQIELAITFLFFLCTPLLLLLLWLQKNWYV